MLAEKINNDLKEAMKNKDSFKLGVIRMIKGAMQLAKPNPREELTRCLSYGRSKSRR